MVIIRDFVQGLYSICGSGSPESKSGYAIHMYTANKSMENCCLANADGDFCIVPQEVLYMEISYIDADMFHAQ